MEEMRADPEYQEFIERHRRMATEGGIFDTDGDNNASLELITEAQANEK